MPEGAPAQQAFVNEPFTLVSAVEGTSGLRQRYQQPLLMILAVAGVVLLIDPSATLRHG